MKRVKYFQNYYQDESEEIINGPDPDDFNDDFDNFNFGNFDDFDDFDDFYYDSFDSFSDDTNDIITDPAYSFLPCNIFYDDD